MDVLTSAADFKKSKVPQLQELDDLLSCHICKDFLKNPVLTPCGHTFCSLCIRGYLSNEPKCPLCLHELRESMLRSEYLVNEITETYKAARQRLLDELNSSETNRDNSVIEVVSDKEPSLLQIDDDVNENSNHITVNDTSDIIDEDNEIQITGTKRTARTILNGSRPTKAAKISDMFTTRKAKTEEKAPCPICSQLFPIRYLERTHLDECLTKPPTSSPPIKQPRLSPKPSESVSHVKRYLNSTNTSTQQRLPKLNFAKMTTSQLKQKLASLSLPVSGTRANMVARYNYYEMLWNSNFIDSINPVSESELRRQLISWDASHNGNNNSSNGGTNTISQLMKMNSKNKGKEYEKLLKDFKKDSFDKKGWMLLHKNSFNRLLCDAKKTRRKTENETLMTSQSPRESSTQTELSAT